MKRNEILRSYGNDYKNMTKRLLEKASLSDMIPSPEARILIKPNLVTCSPAEFGGTTHTEVVAGIIEYLHQNGFRNLVIAEGSWVGDRTAEAFEYCGYNALSKEYGVPLFDTQKDGSFSADCAGMELKICNCVRDADFIINVPVLKGHCQTHVTCALKNMKGLIPNSEKRRFHTMGLHKPIAHLNTVIRPDFIVIDHICGDLDFEEGGNPVVRNCVMAALDPVLTDAYVCALLNYDLAKVPYVPLAEQLGIGSADLSRLNLITCEGDPSHDQPPKERLLTVSYAVDELDSCSACYAALIPALERLKAEGLLDKLEVPVSIGQGHRGKKGVLGIGECTRNFDYYIPGCPPEEEDIYQGLKTFITMQNRS